jgi:ubiquinone/menaquinone biosynthesis C-methylase UbiE
MDDLQTMRSKQPLKTEDLVAQTRPGFDAVLHTPGYHAIHSDAAHLEALMQMTEVQPHKHYLDLGTGNGYLVFELAARFPALLVTGLDIAYHSIQLNQGLQRERGLANLDFQAYEGVRLPFGDAAFWGVLSRYAFHHFPEAEQSVTELSRVVERGGFVLLSDPITRDEDSAGFIDEFQQLKPDGHIHFYRPAELEALFGRHGFEKELQVMSALTYPRELSPAYLELLHRTPAPILEGYCVTIGEKTVQITVDILNVCFRKRVA